MAKYRGQVLPEQFDENIMTDKNSLVANLNKEPALARKVIDMYPQHTLTWLTEKTSRFANKGMESLRDQSFRWQIRTQLTKPSIATGNVKSDGLSAGDAAISGIIGTTASLAIDDKFTVEFKHDHSNGIYGTELHANDMVRFQGGATAIVLSVARKSTTANTSKYDMKFIGGTASDADFAANAIVGFIGSAFGEGSLGGYMNNQYTEWYIQHTTINRAATKITATAQTNVQWVTDGNKYAMWYFEQEKFNDDKFFRGLELQRRYARSSMDAVNGNEWMGGSGNNQLTLDGFNDNNGGITAPQVGAGLYPQFEDANNHAYDITTGLVEEQIQEFVAILAQKAIGGGNRKHEWLVLAGMIGQQQFQKVMTKLVVSSSPGGSYTDLDTGKDMALGTNFTTYYYLNNKITLVHDETLDDPAIHRNQNGLTGVGDLIFLDFSEQDGVSNIELKSVYKRSFIKKYLNGMHSFNGKTEGYAVSGFDGAGSEILAESAMVLRVPTSCGIMSQSGTRPGVTWA